MGQLQASNRSNRWANSKILGQPCEFQVSAAGGGPAASVDLTTLLATKARTAVEHSLNGLVASANARPRLAWKVVGESERDAKLSQKLGRLQPFIAVFAQECMGLGNLHLLGQPNTFLGEAPRNVTTTTLRAEPAGPGLTVELRPMEVRAFVLTF